jgi:hypothetical protein
MKSLIALSLSVVVVSLSSCGKSDSTPGNSSSSSSASSADQAPVDVPPKGPATSTEAARTLDLNKVVLMEGTEQKPEPQQTIANLSSRVKGKVKDVYEFYQKQLAAQRWKIDPNAYVAEDSASATFSRNTFHISLTVSPVSDPGIVEVDIHNHGNIDLSKLPRPPVTKTTYEGPITAMYVTDATVPATAEACRALLVNAGWQPYGADPGSSYYKQNAIRLTVTASAAPAEGGKTMISYFAEQMSADIPLLPDGTEVRYSDSQRELSFASPKTKQEVAAQYQELLAKDGWKSTTEKLITDDRKGFMIFREPGGGMLDLEIRDSGSGCDARISFMTYDEYKAMEKKADERRDAAKKAKAEGQPDQAK